MNDSGVSALNSRAQMEAEIKAIFSAASISNAKYLVEEQIRTTLSDRGKTEGQKFASLWAKAVMIDKNGKYDLAIPFYAAILEFKPTDASIYRTRAKAYLNAGNIHAAVQDYQKAVELEPTDEPTVRRLREAQAKLEEQKQQKSLQRRVESQKVVASVSKEEALIKEVDSKIEAIMRGSLRPAEKLSALKRDISPYFQKGNAVVDFMYCQRILSLDLNDVVAKKGYAESLAKLQEAEQKQEQYSSSNSARMPAQEPKKTPAPKTPSPQSSSPEKSSPNSSPSSSGGSSPKEPAAVPMFRSPYAATSQPSREERIKALWAKANASQTNSEAFLQSIHYYDEIISLDANNADAYFERSFVCFALNRSEQVFSDLDMAIKLQPSNADFLERRAFIDYLLGGKTLAFRQLDEFVERYPANPQGWLNRGKLRRKNEDYEKAISDFEETLKRDPDNARAKKKIEKILAIMPPRKLASYYLHKEEFEKALPHANLAVEEAEKDYKEDPRTIFVLSHVLGTRSKILLPILPDKAIPDLRRIIELDLIFYPPTEYPLVHKAKKEAYKKAEELLRKAEKVEPNTEKQFGFVKEALIIVSNTEFIDQDDEDKLAPPKPEAKLPPPNKELGKAKILSNEPLGKGAYGIVYKSSWNGRIVAVKIPLHDQDGDDSVEREFQLLCGLNHDSIVKTLGYCHPPTGFYHFMEYYEGGCVARYLYNPQKWDNPISWRLRCAVGVSDGLAYLHDKNIIHRDLNPSNVLMRKDGSVVISDFGKAVVLDKNQELKIFDRDVAFGTVYFDAPEILIPRTLHGKVACSKSADIFSFGTFIWVCLAQKSPYEGIEHRDGIREFVGMDNIKGREKIPEKTPPKMAALITHCWMHNPKDRPTAKVVHKELATICAKTIKEDRKAVPTLIK